MSKTALISIIIIILFLILAGGVFWFLTKKPSAPQDDKGFFSGIFPFGGERDIGGPGGVAGQDDLFTSGEGEAMPFMQIAQNVVPGGFSASSTAVFYIERPTGHIYEVSPQGKDRNRVSNTTILKIYEALWSSSGNNLVISYVDDKGEFPEAKNFLAEIVSGGVKGIFLAKAAVEIATSPFEDRIFYLIKSEGETEGFISDFSDKKKAKIFSMPFGEFNISWPAKNIVSFLTKPSGNIPGFVYFLNTRTEIFEKIIGDIRGLTISVSPGAEKVIYSESFNKKITAKIMNVEDRSSSTFPLKTLPEKCAWTEDGDVVFCGVPKSMPRADYPDGWYKGVVSFTDSIWAVNIKTGEAKQLMEDSGADIIKPFVTEDEGYLVFTNKKDYSLWSLRLK